MRRFIVLWILLPMQLALADQVVLTSGEKLQCRIVEQTKKISKYEGIITFRQLRSVRGRKEHAIVISRKSEVLILDEGDRVRSRFGVPYGAELLVK